MGVSLSQEFHHLINKPWQNKAYNYNSQLSFSEWNSEKVQNIESLGYLFATNLLFFLNIFP